MKILVATNETQGQRSNDFCHATEGEVVEFGLQCGWAQTDDHCGCARSMVGVRSGKGTTTMKVVDLEATQDVVQQQINKKFKRGGWSDIPGLKPQKIEQLIQVALPFPLGAIIEYRDATLSIRQIDGCSNSPDIKK